MMALTCERDALLAEARERVIRRSDVTTAAARSAATARELATCLEAGWRCAQALARPAAAVLPLDLQALEREFPGLCAGRDVPCASGAVAFVYLATCGYDSRAALQWLDGDYASYHFQDSFARELVFALGRQVGRDLRAAHPGRRLRREVIGSGCGVAPADRGRRWDPPTVTGLLRRVGGNTLGVSADNGAALRPLHSVLGLMTTTDQPGNQE